MLALAIRDRSISVWCDKKLKPGDKWQDEINNALSRAKVGVLLVTPTFLASNFINDVELAYLVAQAEKGWVKLLWIPVVDSMFQHTPLKHLEAVIDPKQPLKTIRADSRPKHIKRICERIL